MAVKHLGEKEEMVAGEHCQTFTVPGSSIFSLPEFLNSLQVWVLMCGALGNFFLVSFLFV